MINYKYEIGDAVFYKGIQAYIIATLVCEGDLYYYIVFDNFQTTFRDFNSYQFSEKTLHYMLNSLSYKDVECIGNITDYYGRNYTYTLEHHLSR